MEHIDLTIDFETCSLSANAAVMQVAIVPWLRHNEKNPFAVWNLVEPYVGYVDLRTCVVDGFDFDPSTLKWWHSQSESAKKTVTAGLAEPIADILITILDYMRCFVKYGIGSVCLWCQGPDVDIAILRNLCSKYDINLEEIIPHTQFRDCRTLILEGAYIKARLNMSHSGMTDDDKYVQSSEVLVNPTKAYTMFAPLPRKYVQDRDSHDALYDAMRSSWNTWQAMKWLRGY